MKKIKRILALLGAISLLFLYAVAFLTAIFDSSADMRYFKAAVIATVIIPVLIWAYSFIYKLINKSDD